MGRGMSEQQQDRLWKIRYELRGGHYHCTVFSARGLGYTWASSGELVVRQEEWVSFGQIFNNSVQWEQRT